MSGLVRRLVFCAALLCATFAALSAQGTSARAATAAGATAAGATAAPSQPEEGLSPTQSSFEGYASWYGGDFHGKMTSSGELYDKEAFTAAHRSLPFGTMLLVTNLDNGASVVVRVTDRGPFVKGRIIDVSEGAARILGMLPTGTAHVLCRILPAEEAAAFGSPAPAKASDTASTAGQSGAAGRAPLDMRRARIQVASYRDAKNAAETQKRLKMSGLQASIEDSGAYHRVFFADLAASEVDGLVMRLNTLGYTDLLISYY
jgi:rare lipoprotein A